MSTKSINSIVSSLNYDNIKTIIISSSSFVYSTVGIMFKTGSVNDSKEKAGLNYMVYRLLIDHIYRNDLITEIYTSGGLLKTSVEKELICYSIQTFSSNIIDVINKLLSIFDSLHFTDEDLRRIKKNITAESHQVNDNLTEYMYRLTYEKCFSRQSMARSIYGKESTINKITVDDIHEFFYKNYNPRNAVVVIATKEEDINTREIEKSLTSSILSKRESQCINNIKKYRFVASETSSFRNVKNFYSMYTYPINGFNYIDEALKSLIVEEIFNESIKKSILSQSICHLIDFKIAVVHYFNIGLMHFRCVSDKSIIDDKQYMHNIVEKCRPSYIEIYRVLQSITVKIKEFYKDSLNNVLEYAKHYLYVRKIKNPSYEMGILLSMKSDNIVSYMLEILEKQPTTVLINPRRTS